MNPTALFALALLFPAAPPEDDLSQALAEVRVHHAGKTYRGDALPESIGKGPPAAVEAWAAWTLEHGYRMDLVGDGRVLLVSREKSRKRGRQLKLIAETEALFDELVPAPPREEPPEPTEPAEEPGPGDGELPEDPDGGPAGWLPEDEAPLPYTYSYEWGVGTWPVDTETCVLFVVHDEEDYGDLVETLGEMQDYLKPWVAEGKRHTGFVHERPMVAAYIEHAAGQEEFDPDNEVVHRTAHMLFVRRFSSYQPNWAIQGFSWYVEMSIRRSIYCFPYRDEFVWATEHTGWRNELANAFGGREDEPLGLREFAEWRRGKYDARVARIAYGLMAFFAEHRPGKLSGYLEALRLFALEDNRVDVGGGDWERELDYAVPTRKQGELLGEHFGADVLSEATEFFRLGKKYRPKR